MAEIRVTAPQPVTADIAGVAFRKGEATADSVRDRRALAYFRRHGYTVEAADADEQPESKTTPRGRKPAQKGDAS
ncbi:hypothetical protein HHX38_08395 [Streptomyces sp. PKU-MA01144]|uniref:hypothetical protein n=1 Tax=Streptomyces sp. PKU-MA01144 TaxID=2729138 RepID=UPI00147D040E|nr:hypothetical protein [Streptomyces sp. PKU-MA01144]NNJ04153.1 hypothetical protein [Streptomyces sp. PKU-MA01144]